MEKSVAPICRKSITTINAATLAKTFSGTLSKTPVSNPVTMDIGPYSIKEEEDGVVIAEALPWGVEHYRYYCEPKQNCEPQEILPNRSATNVIRFREPFLQKYMELYYTNKDKAIKETAVACLAHRLRQTQIFAH